MSEGEIIWQSVDNLLALERSINAFWRAFEEEIQQKERPICGADLVSVSRGGGSSSPESWVGLSQYGIYALRRRRQNARPFGHVSVRIELWREGAGGEVFWSFARRPLIYVGFCPANDWWDDDGLRLDSRGAPIEGVFPLREGNDRLWIWGDETDLKTAALSERSWFFAVPLESIGTREAIREEIISPVDALFRGELPDSVSGLRNAVTSNGF